MFGVLMTGDWYQYEFAQLVRPFGLTPPQYNVLRILSSAGQPLPCLAIADRLMTRVPAITSLIDKLERRQLVERKRCPQDRRVWYVGLTPAGQKLLATLEQPVQALYARLCRKLSNKECEMLAKLLGRARESCHEAEPE